MRHLLNRLQDTRLGGAGGDLERVTDRRQSWAARRVSRCSDRRIGAPGAAARVDGRAGASATDATAARSPGRRSGAAATVERTEAARGVRATAETDDTGAIGRGGAASRPVHRPAHPDAVLKPNTGDQRRASATA